MKKESAPKPLKNKHYKTGRSNFDKTLVIVESPSKAKTINKYLGPKYVVEASVGHIKDLLKFGLGVDIENDFTPKYVTVKGKAEIIKKFKKYATEADNVLIATDPDREGEAIAWHIAEQLKASNPNIKRVVFNEITKNSIKNSISSPRDIDIKMFHSQQARRVMDRIIGFKVSPFLANTMLDKTTETVSAGRVQSVAVRLICERETEINSFESIEYLLINAIFTTENGEPISAKLVAFDGNTIKNPEGSKKNVKGKSDIEVRTYLDNLHYIKTEEQAKKLLSKIKEQSFSITNISKKQATRKPASPFTTSLLQQDASRKLGFSSKKTMLIAQKLYEGVSIGHDGITGLITYMRTDSVRIAPESASATRNYIIETFGEKYAPSAPNIYKSKSTNIQDAHEAIRPTNIFYTPSMMHQYLEKDELALYTLIYNRFLASQMSSAIIEQTNVNISSADNNEISDSTELCRFEFRATGSVIVFDGFLRVYSGETSPDTADNTNLPKGLYETQKTALQKADMQLAATRPPARYNEASLVKEMDELGIGRPSTYAQVVSTLLDRNYVELHSKAFYPTEIGMEVCRVLVACFEALFNVDFTAKMEAELDLIADGNATYLSTMQTFYEPFVKSLDEAQMKVKSISPPIICEICGGEMIIKISRRGRFLGCKNYPDCTNTRSLTAKPESTDMAPPPEPDSNAPLCSKCGSPMIIRNGKYGKFYGCSGYPACDNIQPISSKIKCPKCGEGEVVEHFSPKTKRKFWSCTKYPACDFISNNELIQETCSSCGNNLLEYRYKKIPTGFQKYKICPKCKKEDIAGDKSYQWQ